MKSVDAPGPNRSLPAVASQPRRDVHLDVRLSLDLEEIRLMHELLRDYDDPRWRMQSEAGQAAPSAPAKGVRATRPSIGAQRPRIAG